MTKNLPFLIKKLTDSYFLHFFEDGTKTKIHTLIPHQGIEPRSPTEVSILSGQKGQIKISLSSPGWKPGTVVVVVATKSLSFNLQKLHYLNI